MGKPVDTATGRQAGAVPYTEEVTACYGIACRRRGSCELYVAIGRTEGGVIESCQRGDTWPLYRPLQGENFGGINA